MYDKIKANSVEAKNQLSNYIVFHNPEGKGKRVIFAGNSITLHGPKEEIGWYGNHGMAASKEENDYVHILMRKFTEEYGDCAFCVCQVSKWEHNDFNNGDCLDLYIEARNFNADVVIARFVENYPTNGFDAGVFEKEYTKLIDHLNPTKNAEVIFTSSFWRHPADEIIKKVATQKNGAFVYLGDLGENDKMQALGLFSHNGVAIHPGDKGMAEIASRIWDARK